MTLANKAYDCIRADIIRGILAPETPLRLAELKEAYGMGFSPLREALNRLKSERLVDAFNLKGFRVALWSLSEMHDAMQTRIEIETQALRAAIANGDVEWEGRIVSSLHALNRFAARSELDEDVAELEKRHFKFHRALISSCGSPWKLSFFEQLYGATERYRIPALLNRTSGLSRDINAEHSALADAALDRDADLACSRLQSHYRDTENWIAAQMSSTAAKRA